MCRNSDTPSSGERNYNRKTSGAGASVGEAVSAELAEGLLGDAQVLGYVFEGYDAVDAAQGLALDGAGVDVVAAAEVLKALHGSGHVGVAVHVLHSVELHAEQVAHPDGQLGETAFHGAVGGETHLPAQAEVESHEAESGGFVAEEGRHGEEDIAGATEGHRVFAPLFHKPYAQHGCVEEIDDVAGFVLINNYVASLKPYRFELAGYFLYARAAHGIEPVKELGEGRLCVPRCVPVHQHRHAGLGRRHGGILPQRQYLPLAALQLAIS